MTYSSYPHPTLKYQTLSFHYFFGSVPLCNYDAQLDLTDLLQVLVSENVVAHLGTVLELI